MIRYPNSPQAQAEDHRAATRALFFRAVDRGILGTLGYADQRQQRKLAQSNLEKGRAESTRRWDADFGLRSASFDLGLMKDVATIYQSNPEQGDLLMSQPSIRARFGGWHPSMGSPDDYVQRVTTAAPPAPVAPYASPMAGPSSPMSSGAPTASAGYSPAPWDGPDEGASPMSAGTAGRAGPLPPRGAAPPPMLAGYGLGGRFTSPAALQADAAVGEIGLGVERVTRPLPEQVFQPTLGPARDVRRMAKDRGISDFAFGDFPGGGGDVADPNQQADAAAGAFRGMGVRSNMASTGQDFGKLAETLAPKVNAQTLPAYLLRIDQEAEGRIQSLGRFGQSAQIIEWRDATKGSLRLAMEANEKAALAKAAWDREVLDSKERAAGAKAKAARRPGKGPSRDERMKQAYQLRTSGMASSDPAEQAKLIAAADKIDQSLGLPVGSGNSTTVEHERRAYGGIGSVNEPGAVKGAVLDDKTQERLLEAAGAGPDAVRKVLETTRPGANITPEEVRSATKQAQQARLTRDTAASGHAEAVRRFTAQPTLENYQAALRLGQAAGIKDAPKKLEQVVKAKKQTAQAAYSQADAAARKIMATVTAMDPADRTPEVIAVLKAERDRLAQAKAELDQVTGLLGMGSNQ